MDLETSQAFAKVLEYLVDSIGGLIEESGSDMTEYLKSLSSEIVAYKLGIAYLWLGVAALVLVIAVAVFIFSSVKKDGCIFLVSIGLLCIALIIGMVNAYTVVECKTFPEKVVIDYIQEVYNSITYSR